MRVKWAGYKGDKLLAMIGNSIKPLAICKDIPCPYGFILDEKKDLVLREGVQVYETDLREHLGKRRVARFEAGTPRKIAEARDRVGYSITFEADIPYVRRLFVDRVLEPDWDNVFVWLDIEVDDSRGFPKPERDPVVSIAFSLDGSKIDFLHLGGYASERAMLDEFKNILLSSGKSVAVGWNVDFDLSFLSKRGKIDFLSGLDLMYEYRDNVKGLEHYSLDFVARHEGLGGKPTNKRVHEMTRQELEEYNRNDVALLLEIDKKYGFSKLRAKVGELVGLLNDDLTPVRMGDTLILRRARELGYVLSNTVNVRKKGYPGAVVFEPVRKGLIRNVAVLDYESLYPNVIVNEKIDIPGFSGEVMPYIEARLMELRREAKKRFKETGDQRYDIEQWALKILANSLYGLFGTEGFRFFDEGIASKITSKGREMLMTARDIVESLGYVVVYGDSVSGDSQIYYFTPDGTLHSSSIEEFFSQYGRDAKTREDGKEEAFISHLHLLTPSLDTATGDVGLGEIVRVVRHRIRKPMCEVESESGKRVRVTVDHSLIVFDKLRGEYVEASCRDLALDHGRYFLISLPGDLAGIVTPRKWLTGKIDGGTWLRLGRAVRLERVKRVSLLGECDGFVYDLEVSGGHTFLANGLFVHNTDSIFVMGWKDENDLSFLESSINAVVSPYKMKLEYMGDLYIMAKKRYILRTRDGKEIVKGVELVRSDWAPLFKQVVKDVVDILFKGGGRREVNDYLAKVKIQLWSGSLNNELIICKGVSLKEYKVEAEHVRAVKKLCRQTGIPLDAVSRICYYYVNGNDGVEPVDPLNPVFPKKPHYQRYWDRIMTLVERIVATNLVPS